MATPRRHGNIHSDLQSYCQALLCTKRRQSRRAEPHFSLSCCTLGSCFKAHSALTVVHKTCGRRSLHLRKLKDQSQTPFCLPTAAHSSPPPHSCTLQPLASSCCNGGPSHSPCPSHRTLQLGNPLCLWALVPSELQHGSAG